MPPSILMALVIALVYGSGFHALVGRRAWQWPVYCVAATAGFFLGYIAGVVLSIDVLLLGSIPLLPATAGALFLLGLAWYFTAPAGDS
jgi:hypothetical protein